MRDGFPGQHTSRRLERQDALSRAGFPQDWKIRSSRQGGSQRERGHLPRGTGEVVKVPEQERCTASPKQLHRLVQGDGGETGARGGTEMMVRQVPGRGSVTLPVPSPPSKPCPLGKANEGISCPSNTIQRKLPLTSEHISFQSFFCAFVTRPVYTCILSPLTLVTTLSGTFNGIPSC